MFIMYFYQCIRVSSRILILKRIVYYKLRNNNTQPVYRSYFIFYNMCRYTFLNMEN